MGLGVVTVDMDCHCDFLVIGNTTCSHDCEPVVFSPRYSFILYLLIYRAESVKTIGRWNSGNIYDSGKVSYLAWW